MNFRLRSGQIRSNFEVGLFKQHWCLSVSVFDGEFNGGIFIFVDGLELPKIVIRNDIYVFHVFLRFGEQKLTDCFKI